MVEVMGPVVAVAQVTADREVAALAEASASSSLHPKAAPQKSTCPAKNFFFAGQGTVCFWFLKRILANRISPYRLLQLPCQLPGMFAALRQIFF